MRTVLSWVGCHPHMGRRGLRRPITGAGEGRALGLGLPVSRTWDRRGAEAAAYRGVAARPVAGPEGAYPRRSVELKTCATVTCAGRSVRSTDCQGVTCESWGSKPIGTKESADAPAPPHHCPLACRGAVRGGRPVSREPCTVNRLAPRSAWSALVTRACGGAYGACGGFIGEATGSDESRLSESRGSIPVATRLHDPRGTRPHLVPA